MTHAGNVGTLQPATYGTLDAGADGSYTYTLNNTAPVVQQLAPGRVGHRHLQLPMTDEHGGTATANLTITITGTTTRRWPTTTAHAVTEDATLAGAGNVLANDTDVDDGDTRP